MSQSENIQNLRKWESRIKAIKDLESQETSLESALNRTLNHEGKFRLKLMVKSEKPKQNPTEMPSDFEEFLRDSGVLQINKDEKETTYSTVLDISFLDEFVVEFLLYWYRRTKKAKESLINKPI